MRAYLKAHSRLLRDAVNRLSVCQFILQSSLLKFCAPGAPCDFMIIQPSEINTVYVKISRVYILLSCPLNDAVDKIHTLLLSSRVSAYLLV